MKYESIYKKLMEISEAPLDSPSQLPFSSIEAKQLAEKDVVKIGKVIGKASAQSVKIMMDGVKGGKYDAMDIIQSIKSGPAQDTSKGIRDMLIVLWSKVDKRFRSYLRGKKRR